MMEKKLQELLSSVSQMSPLFLLISSDSIILMVFLFLLPPEMLCSSQERCIFVAAAFKSFICVLLVKQQ